MRREVSWLLFVVALASLSFSIWATQRGTPISASSPGHSLPSRSPEKPKPNICGFYLGMTQLEVIDAASQLGIQLEPGGVSPHPFHLFPVEGAPVLISYDEERRIRWVAGPRVELRSGVELVSKEMALEEKLEPLNVEDVSLDALCEGAIRGFQLEPEVLLSVRKDGSCFYSLGPDDGWQIAKSDGLTWQKLKDEL